MPPAFQRTSLSAPPSVSNKSFKHPQSRSIRSIRSIALMCLWDGKKKRAGVGPRYLLLAQRHDSFYHSFFGTYSEFRAAFFASNASYSHADSLNADASDPWCSVSNRLRCTVSTVKLLELRSSRCDERVCPSTTVSVEWFAGNDAG